MELGEEEFECAKVGLKVGFSWQLYIINELNYSFRVGYRTRHPRSLRPLRFQQGRQALKGGPHTPFRRHFQVHGQEQAYHFSRSQRDYPRLRSQPGWRNRRGWTQNVSAESHSKERYLLICLSLIHQTPYNFYFSPSALSQLLATFKSHASIAYSDVKWLFLRNFEETIKTHSFFLIKKSWGSNQ